MSENKPKIFSNHENLRLCIIENSIFIEETISYVLGTILNIEWKDSKSFGFSSSALSFNQKVQLILDIKGLEKESLNRLTTLMNIRNKFAHLSEIETFNDLFTKTTVGKEVERNFNKLYLNNKDVTDIPRQNHEKVYRICFYLLVDSVIDILLNITKKHVYELGYADGRKEFNEKLTEELLDMVESTKGGKEAVDSIIDKIHEELKK